MRPKWHKKYERAKGLKTKIERNSKIEPNRITATEPKNTLLADVDAPKNDKKIEVIEGFKMDFDDRDGKGSSYLNKRKLEWQIDISKYVMETN